MQSLDPFTTGLLCVIWQCDKKLPGLADHVAMGTVQRGESRPDTSEQGSWGGSLWDGGCEEPHPGK